MGYFFFVSALVIYGSLFHRSKSYEIGVAGLYPINLTTSGSTSSAKTAVSKSDTYPTYPADNTNAISCDVPSKSRLLNKHHGSAFEVENFDVSHLITSHTDYPRVLPDIIALLNL